MPNSNSTATELATNADYSEVLQRVCSQVVDAEGQRNTIVVNRARLLTSAVTAVNRPRFRSNCALRVEFAGEEALDQGGPKREFFWYK